MTWNLGTYDIHAKAQSTQAIANLVFEDATKIVKGGTAAAQQYAKAFFQATPTELYMSSGAAKRQQMVINLAETALQSARAITAKGRPWFIHETGTTKMLVVCALTEKTGFWPWAPVELLRDADGQKNPDDMGPVWQIV